MHCLLYVETGVSRSLPIILDYPGGGFVNIFVLYHLSIMVPNNATVLLDSIWASITSKCVTSCPDDNLTWSSSRAIHDFLVMKSMFESPSTSSCLQERQLLQAQRRSSVRQMILRLICFWTTCLKDYHESVMISIVHTPMVMSVKLANLLLA